MANTKTIKPQMKLFTLQELQRLALLQILADSGVDDPVAFLEANDVQHMASYKSSVLALAVNGSTPKDIPSPAPSAAPSSPREREES